MEILTEDTGLERDGEKVYLVKHQAVVKEEERTLSELKKEKANLEEALATAIAEHRAMEDEFQSRIDALDKAIKELEE